MKKLLSFGKSVRFLLLLAAAVLLLDGVLSVFYGRYLLQSGDFWLNDYELTRRDHPEKVWDKVIFGSSELVSGYREEDSKSGYVNLGMDYGTVADMLAMLRCGTVTVGSDLVLAVDSLCFFDKMDTNPTYPWHRHWYEPYAYFMRDRLSVSFRRLLGPLGGESPAQGAFLTQQKEDYRGCLSEEELAEKLEKFNTMFWSNPVEDYRGNLKALEELAALCERRGIRLRLLWLPRNPLVTEPEITSQVKALVNASCERLGLEVCDLTDALEAECFHDLGHMNREYGSYRFMEVAEPWLNS